MPEVIDTWYDSGAMPFAQWGYQPDLGRGMDEFAAMFPADFISEAIDQTRGWFYTLMAEGVLHFDETAYRNVVCIGHIVAEDGKKMSKSLGNMFDPWEALERQGADALRWWMLTSGSPWEPRRIGHEIIDEAVRQLLLTLWNTYAFFVTYANARAGSAGADPSRGRPRAWTDGRSAPARDHGGRGPDGWMPTTQPARAARSTPSSTNCRTGTSGAPAAVLEPGRRGGRE